MAVLARDREAGGPVVRVRRRRVVRLVAGVAVRRRSRVTAAHVAAGAVDPLVGPGEREPRLVVIGRRRPPGAGGVAGLALRRERGGLVVRVRRARVVRLVAGVAVRRSPCVPAARVATSAVHALVGPGEREPRRLVIEVRGPPGRGRVAALALRREVRGLVVRVRRGRVVRLVAGIAVRRGAGVAASHVALRAVSPVVGAGQREPRRLVIEVRRAPGAGVVAVLTLGREARGPCGWGSWYGRSPAGDRRSSSWESPCTGRWRGSARSPRGRGRR